MSKDQGEDFANQVSETVIDGIVDSGVINDAFSGCFSLIALAALPAIAGFVYFCV